jgi:murein DD-endopeptidase MepM/ murein hydrolase activator NlpD
LGLLVAAGGASFSSSNAYVVQAGDTLWALSRAYGVTVDQLAAANDMSPQDLLLIGRHLAIPSAATTPSASTSSGASSSGGSVNRPNFCATFVASPGPWGQLPSLLASSPDRLALRPLFRKWAWHYGVSPALVEAIAWQESGWQEGVVSSANAVGVGQIIPSTADFITQQLIGMPLNIASANDNIRMSAALLAYLYRTEGSLCLTIAAYYQGTVNLRQYGVFAETQPYVANVEALIPRFQ